MVVDAISDPLCVHPYFYKVFQHPSNIGSDIEVGKIVPICGNIGFNDNLLTLLLSTNINKISSYILGDIIFIQYLMHTVVDQP